MGEIKRHFADVFDPLTPGRRIDSMNNTASTSVTPEAPAKRKPGRPPRDVSQYIGVTFRRLTIESDAGPALGDGHRMVQCSCVCGSSFTARLRNILEGKQQSCGCLSAQNFEEFRIRKARELSDYQRRQVFHDSMRFYLDDRAVGLKNGVSRYAVRAAVAMHEKFLLETYGELFRTSRYSPSRKELKLSEFELAYLVKHASPHPEGLEMEWADLSNDEKVMFMKFCPEVALSVAA